MKKLPDPVFLIEDDCTRNCVLLIGKDHMLEQRMVFNSVDGRASIETYTYDFMERSGADMEKLAARALIVVQPNVLMNGDKKAEVRGIVQDNKAYVVLFVASKPAQALTEYGALMYVRDYDALNKLLRSAVKRLRELKLIK